MFTISGFYKFKKINSLKKYKTYLENEISNTSIRGSIIISSEGINGTIAKPEATPIPADIRIAVDSEISSNPIPLPPL